MSVMTSKIFTSSLQRQVNDSRRQPVKGDRPYGRVEKAKKSDAVEAFIFGKAKKFSMKADAE